MPQIKCLADYSEGPEHFVAERVYHFEEERAARLMRGSPDSWELVEGEVEIGGPDERVNYAERDREATGAADARAAARADQDREDAARLEQERRANADNERSEAEETEAARLAEERAAQPPASTLAVPPDAPPDEDEGEDDVDLLEEMTVPQLKEHAAGLGIDLGDARTRQAIRDAITSAGDDTEDD